MFDVGFTELLLIGVVALVVIGPERLPAVARTVGQYVGKLQRFVTGVKRDIRNELESGELKQLLGDQKNQIDELRKMVTTTRKDLESGTREVMADAKRKFAEVETSAKGGGATSTGTTTPASVTAPAAPLSIAKDAPADSSHAASAPVPVAPSVPLVAAPVPVVSPDVPPAPAPVAPPVQHPAAVTTDRIPGTSAAPTGDGAPSDAAGASGSRVGNG